MVQGTVAPGYEGVRAAFERCFAELGETGAQVAALVDGILVVDLWGGEGMARDALVHVYSVTKAAAAFCVLVLADRGRLTLDDAVGGHWPEFAAAGKGRTTVRQLLSHQAGLVALREPRPPELLLDWDATCATLAAEAPWWEPGTAHAEHALFYGHLAGELVRRVDGRSLGAFWREEVAQPWRLDVHVGLGDAELARTVDLVGELDDAAERSDLYRQALGNPPGARDLAVVNGEPWRRAEIPAVNGHATALGVARFYAGLVAGGTLDGVRLVGPDTVAAMRAGERTAHDALLGEEVTWGLGVWVDHDGFGMAGIGGSLGMADPDTGLAEAYITRQMGDHERCGIVDVALREALASA
jgi:CubicO group peptidase (beta-lactamase class C family)